MSRYDVDLGTVRVCNDDSVGGAAVESTLRGTTGARWRFKSEYQRIPNTIVQLPHFDASVFMHSARAKQIRYAQNEKFSGAHYGSNQCYPSARPGRSYPI